LGSVARHRHGGRSSPPHRQNPRPTRRFGAGAGGSAEASGRPDERAVAAGRGDAGQLARLP
jgi:hypothetical protein